MAIHKRFYIVLFLVCNSVVAFAESSPPLRILTTEYLPYSYEEFSSAKGFSVDIVKALLAHTEIETKIEVLPWARSYNISLERPNTLIFSIARTPEREAFFHWIGKLFHMKTYFYIAADREDIHIRSLDDARNYVVSGVISGAPSRWLEAQGVQMFNSTGLYDSRIKMLINHRIDVLLSDPMSMESEMQLAKLDVGLVKPILYLPEPSYDLYLAFSKGTQRHYIEALTDAYNKLVASGEYERLTQPFHERYKHLSIPQ